MGFWGSWLDQRPGEMIMLIGVGKTGKANHRSFEVTTRGPTVSMK